MRTCPWHPGRLLYTAGVGGCSPGKTCGQVGEWTDFASLTMMSGMKSQTILTVLVAVAWAASCRAAEKVSGDPSLAPEAPAESMAKYGVKIEKDVDYLGAG